MIERICLCAVVTFWLGASTANADPIVLNLGGTSSNAAGFYGQSVTTPVGGPWNDITFAFLGPVANSQAAGTLYLLSMEYVGAPGNLSSSTMGFLAQSLFVGEGTGAWMFAPDVTLHPSTTYFLYSNFNFPAGTFLGGNTGVSGSAYFSSGGNFASLGSVDENFRLTGSIAPIPEPSTLTMLLLSSVPSGLLWNRRRIRTLR